MPSTFWDKIAGLPLIVSDTAARPSRLEEEVVSLFDQLRVPVLRYLLSLRIPAADAEEIVQESFLLLFQRLEQGRRSENPQGWVFRTAHNLALRHRTRIRRHSDHFSEAGDLS